MYIQSRGAEMTVNLVEGNARVSRRKNGLCGRNGYEFRWMAKMRRQPRRPRTHDGVIARLPIRRRWVPIETSALTQEEIDASSAWRVTGLS
jgi:hypothetical protein